MAVVKFLTNIDLSDQELQNAKLQHISSDPTGVEGKIFYHSGTNVIKFYNGSAWIALSAATGDITSVVAGTGLTGGATSGAATVNVIGGTGITANANDIAITAGGVDTTQLANNAVTEDKVADALLAEIDANTAKVTNVATNLAITGSAAARVITSSDGTNATIPLATTSVSGLLSPVLFDEIDANTAKTTNATTDLGISGSTGARTITSHLR